MTQTPEVDTMTRDRFRAIAALLESASVLTYDASGRPQLDENITVSDLDPRLIDDYCDAYATAKAEGWL